MPNAKPMHLSLINTYFCVVKSVSVAGLNPPSAAFSHVHASFTH